VWCGDLTGINGTSIRLEDPYHSLAPGGRKAWRNVPGGRSSIALRLDPHRPVRGGS